MSQNITLEKLDAIRSSGFRPGIVGCFLYEKRVLFVYHKKYSLWQLPQGGIENGELLGDALARELSEELGEHFILEQCEHSFDLFADNKVEFPKKEQGRRVLRTNDGKELIMVGKKYYFIAINVIDPELRLDETEFDDYYWLSYEESIRFCETIYQHGKRRITLFAIERMKEEGFIE